MWPFLPADSDGENHDAAQDERATGPDPYSAEWPYKPLKLSPAGAAVHRGLAPTGASRNLLLRGAPTPLDSDARRSPGVT